LSPTVRGSAYIRNDDGPSLTIDNAVTIDEGNPPSNGHPARTRRRLLFIFSAASTQTVTVNWSTANGTAGPADYTVANGTVIFLPGETNKKHHHSGERRHDRRAKRNLQSEFEQSDVCGSCRFAGRCLHSQRRCGADSFRGRRTESVTWAITSQATAPASQWKPGPLSFDGLATNERL